MAHDPDALFPTGSTTRRGLLSAFSRRAVEAMPVPDALAPRPTTQSFYPVSLDDSFPEEPQEWLEPILAGEDLVDEIKASATEPGMHIWWLGQSGFVVEIDGQRIVFDPYLSDSLTEKYASTETPHERMTGLVVAPELLSFVDVVTSSHAHGDHLDVGTLPGILSGVASFVCAAGSEAVAAERAGRKPDVVLDVHEEAMIGDIWIQAVPAYHEDAPEAVGYVVRKDQYAIYHSGDTRRVQGMAESVLQHAVDAAIIPINGQWGNMDGADAARLAYEAAAPIVIPCHHGMFRHNTASTSRFVAECVRIGQEYRLPRPGERITIDHGY